MRILDSTETAQVSGGLLGLNLNLNLLGILDVNARIGGNDRGHGGRGGRNDCRHRSRHHRYC